MKSLIRTMVGLAAVTLAVGGLVAGQEGIEEIRGEGSAETTTGQAVTKKVVATPVVEAVSVAVPPEPASNVAPPGVSLPMTPPVPFDTGGMVTRRVVLGGGGRGRVLVVPTEEIKAEELADIRQDLCVMSHILDKKLSRREYNYIEGVFVDFGDFFSRGEQGTEVIYLQGYGALFLMSVNIPLSPAAKAEQEQGEQAEEAVDSEWQQAQEELSGKIQHPGPTAARQEYDPERLEELKKELVKTLKHAANIRNLKQDEWIIVTVSGGGQAGGGMFAYEFRTRSTPGSSSSVNRGKRGGSYGFGRGAGGGAAFGGGFGGGARSTMGFAGEGPATDVTLTIRVRKSDVDEFAKGALSLEQFQEKVKIVTY